MHLSNAAKVEKGALDVASARVYKTRVENWRSEFAEAIPFSRTHIAEIVGVSAKTISNWIDRNQLWPEGRQKAFRGYYRLSDVFDIAGFSALRAAKMSEGQAAQYVRNYGFYRHFLHGDQMVDFSYRNGVWDIGLYDPSAVVSLRINMRTVGGDIFRRLSETLSESNGWPTESFISFRRLYGETLRHDLLSSGTAPLFEVDAE